MYNLKIWSKQKYSLKADLSAKLVQATENNYESVKLNKAMAADYRQIVVANQDLVKAIKRLWEFIKVQILHRGKRFRLGNTSDK